MRTLYVPHLFGEAAQAKLTAGAILTPAHVQAARRYSGLWPPSRASEQR